MLISVEGAPMQWFFIRLISTSQGHFPQLFAVDAFGGRFRWVRALNSRITVSEDPSRFAGCLAYLLVTRGMEINMVREHHVDI